MKELEEFKWWRFSVTFYPADWQRIRKSSVNKKATVYHIGPFSVILNSYKRGRLPIIQR